MRLWLCSSHVHTTGSRGLQLVVNDDHVGFQEEEMTAEARDARIADAIFGRAGHLRFLHAVDPERRADRVVGVRGVAQRVGQRLVVGEARQPAVAVLADDRASPSARIVLWPRER